MTDDSDFERLREKVSFGKARVFVSYSHADRQFAAAICDGLNSLVLDIFLDQSRLHPGWKWELRLMDALDKADVLLLLVGADTMSRPYVRKEIEAYLSSRKHSEQKIIPVLLPGSEGLPPELASYQWYDLRDNLGGESVRLLIRACWNYYTGLGPDEEIKMPEGKANADTSNNSHAAEIEKMWKSGEIGISPTALTQLINLGIAQVSTLCRHLEDDLITLAPKGCDSSVQVICIGCLRGTCTELFHVYCSFCTVLPPQLMFDKGTKLFYWCPNCHSPICTYCLGVEDDYPCPPEQVLSYRFRCPACRKTAQVVPILNVDFKGIAEAVIKWSRAGGPPLSEK